MKKKIMMVFGTRPEAIKMAPLYHDLRERSSEFQVLVCVTAQHRDMLDQVLKVFDISVDVDLNLMKPSQDLVDVTSSVLLGMRDMLVLHKPEVLLVHGDTATTLAASMAAFYCNIPVGHVEAGLRTHNIFAPFPEEFNRQITSKIARFHFSPTNSSRQNLIDERVPADQIYVTGNTIIDSMKWIFKRLECDQERRNLTVNQLKKLIPFDWQSNKYILITGHRRENFGNGFLNICYAVADLAKKYPAIHFLYPVHLNPNVQKPVLEILSGFSNVHLVAPIDYEPFLILLRNCYLVLTDSGGIQEEAPSLGKPVLLMRDVTERPEAVIAGAVRLVGADRDTIFSEMCKIFDDEKNYSDMSVVRNLYGDGNACRRIIEVLGKI